MSSRTEYLDALLAAGSPLFAGLALALCLGVFVTALILMACKSPAARRRAAMLPLDSFPTEANCD